MRIDLDNLIQSLAPEAGQEKQASEAEQVAAPTVAEDLKNSLMTKVASERRTECEDLGRQLAARLMEKVAASKEDDEDKKDEKKDDEKKDEQEKKAAEAPLAGPTQANADFADHVESLLNKEAEAGTSAQPNLAIEPTAGMAAEQTQVDAQAKQSGGTVEQQQNESLQKGLATQSACAGPDDKVEANMLKAAAVSSLVGDGMDFYDAFILVKEADHELQKEAAYNQLVSEGYDMESAVALVKQASEAVLGEQELSKEAQLSYLLAEGLSFDDAVATINSQN